MGWLRGPHAAPPASRRAAGAVQARQPVNSADADRLRAQRLAALAARQTARARTRKRIEYEDRIVERSRLDVSLLLLLNEIHDWPARWQRAERPTFEARDIRAQQRQSPDLMAHRVEFTFHDERYRVEVDIPAQGACGGRSGKLRFLQNDKLMLAAHISGPADGAAAPARWDRLKVDMLEPGPWVGHIGEIEEQIRFASERHVLHQELARLMHQDDPGQPH